MVGHSQTKRLCTCLLVVRALLVLLLPVAAVSLTGILSMSLFRHKCILDVPRRSAAACPNYRKK